MQRLDYYPSQLPDVDAVELVGFKILQPIRVEGETAQQIAHLWRQLPPDEQMRCHLPLFALRFYEGNQLLVQGSICWECNNIFVKENGKDLVYEFDGLHAHSQEFLALLQQIAAQSS